MGEVYRARDPRLGRDVAIKLLPERLVDDGHRLARFRQEARAIAALSHPNILTVYDIGEEDKKHYVVTEILEGEPGRQHPAAGPDVEGDVLVAGGDSMGGTGIRRLVLAHGPAGWSATERWASKGLKPCFSDFVVHEGHAFGFDGSILSCIDLEDGTRKWKGGRYGHGQLVLLPEQDLLLVLSEDEELALVGATAARFTEMARVPASQGKTWNHPVLVGDVLLVRNGEEMAAFRLARAGG
jgi:hypothetical protein